MSNELTEHYATGNLANAITTALGKVVTDGRSPTIDDLAPVDEFHIGGRRASVSLFDQLNLSSSDRVLDVGAGIGGTARFVAQNYGSNVVGIDLTPEFCEVAETLSNLVGLGDKVTVHEGSALAMPFESESFDSAYMMHVGMNIEDKAALFAEVNRVLRPGGRFAVYDILAGQNSGDFQFPVPWATDANSSFLTSPDEMKSLLEQAGFTVDVTNDRTEFAAEFFESAVAAMASGPPPVGLHLIMGPTARDKFGNMIQNVKAGMCGPWEFIASKK